MADENINILVTGKDAASGPLSNIRRTLSGLQQDVKGGILSGIGLGAGISAFNLVGDAVRGVTGLLGDSVTSAKNLQAANAVLFASIKQNIPAWDGSTAAIDKATAAGERLGFTNLEQRDSMGLLVAQTRNVNDALLAQRAAMDLARLTGKDLSIATLLVGKAYDGNTTALKKLGVEVPKGVKGMEAVAAIEKIAAGSAVAFGQTSAGAMDKANAAVEALKEKAGTALLPVLTDLATFAADTLLPAISGAADAISRAGPLLDVLRIAAEVLAVVLTAKLVIGLGRAALGMFGLVGPAAAATGALTEEAAAADLAGKAGLGLLGPIALAGGALLLLGDQGAKVSKAIAPIAFGFNELAGKSHIAQTQIRQDLHDTAAQLGITEDDVRTRVLHTAQALGIDYPAALKIVQANTYKAAKDVGVGTQAGLREGLVAGQPAVVQQMVLTGDALLLAQTNTNNDAVAAENKLPGDLAAALHKGRQIVKDAWTTFLDDQKTVMTQAQKEAYDKGILADKRLAAGLRDARPEVRAAAEAARNAAEAGLTQTRQENIDIFNAGWGIASQWIAGIVASLNAGKGNIQTEVATLRNTFGHSLPTEGPLKGDAAFRGGLAIAKDWVRGLFTGIGGFSMPNLLAGSMGAPSLALAAGGSLPSRGGVNLTINFNSTFPPTPAQAQASSRQAVPEFVRELRRQRIIQ